MCVCVGFYFFIYLPPISWFVYFQGQSSQEFEICCIIPGREIPKWFEKVNICDTLVVPRYDLGRGRTYKIKKVKIQLPGSGSGCDGWRGIVLCVVFLPTEPHHRYQRGYRESIFVTGPYFFDGLYASDSFEFPFEYGEVETQHLWLHSVSKNRFCRPKTPGSSVDKKGFHQVELGISPGSLKVEKIGFLVV